MPVSVSVRYTVVPEFSTFVLLSDLASITVVFILRRRRS
jgi:hypothetical protein